MTYVSEEAKVFKQHVGLIAKLAGIKPTNDSMRINITLHPKLTKAGKSSLVCLDLDNSIKVSLDALNGIAWHDDKQVRAIHAQFGDSIPDGGLTVSVGRMDLNG